MRKKEITHTMFVPQRALNIIDRSIRHAAALEHVKPVLGRLQNRHTLDHRFQHCPVGYPKRIGQEAWIRRPLGSVQLPTQHAEKPVVAATEQNVAVGGLEGRVWDYGG